MSFTLQLWQKPGGWPWPQSSQEAAQQIGCLLSGPAPGQNPAFLEFGLGLYERFPQGCDVWLDGSECGETSEAVLTFGMTAGDDGFDDAYGWAIEVAGRLGLVLTDPRTGDTFLPDGRHIDAMQASMPAPMPSTRHLSAEELREAVAGREPEALYELGRRLRYGFGGQRRHLWLSYALLRLGAHDDASRAAADERWQQLGDEDLPPLEALLNRLATAQDGVELLAIVDAECQILDDDFANAQVDLLDTRTRDAGVDSVFECAAAGHEVAAYEAALYSLVAGEAPDWQRFDTWSRIAAEWGHEPARELRHHVLGRGIADPQEVPDAAKAAWWLAQLTVTPRDWPTEGEALAQVVAWYANEELPLALFTRADQLEKGRAGLKRDRTRALDCHIRAAEQGHADATGHVAVLLKTAKVPGTLIAALFLLAHSRGSPHRADLADGSAEEKDKVRSMMRELARPGRLRAVIHTYARTPAPQTAPPRAPEASAPETPKRETPVPETLVPESRASESQGPLADAPAPRPVPSQAAAAESSATIDAPATPDDGVVAPAIPVQGAENTTGLVARGNRWLLVPGVVGLPLMMALARPGDGFWLGVALSALLAGWGVWYYTGQRQWAGVKRLVLAVLAALPVGGMLVSVLLLAQSFHS